MNEPCAAFRLLSGSRIVLVPAGTMTSFSGLRRRPSTLSTSRPRFGTRSAFRCRGPRSKAWHRVVRGQRSWSSRRLAATRRAAGCPKSAIAATIEELERCGVPDERQTILVAGGLGRRFAQRDLERLLPPSEAREFRGRVVVHDAEDERWSVSGERVASIRISSRPTSC